MRYILAYFRGCDEPVRYTAAVYRLLVTDPDVVDIVDATTGEILYSA